jgi:hypothetical protein
VSTGQIIARSVTRSVTNKVVGGVVPISANRWAVQWVARSVALVRAARSADYDAKFSLICCDMICL